MLGGDYVITIRNIDTQMKDDINIPNEPFSIFGRVIPSYTDGRWTYEVIRFAPENVTEMKFPDENYRYEDMPDSTFLGAYDGEKCVGLAILQPGFFKYMYLYDLKVIQAYRGQHIGKNVDKESEGSCCRTGILRDLYAGSGQQSWCVPVLSSFRLLYWWTGYQCLSAYKAGG